MCKVRVSTCAQGQCVYMCEVRVRLSHGRLTPKHGGELPPQHVCWYVCVYFHYVCIYVSIVCMNECKCWVREMELFWQYVLHVCVHVWIVRGSHLRYIICANVTHTHTHTREGSATLTRRVNSDWHMIARRTRDFAAHSTPENSLCYGPLVGTLLLVLACGCAAQQALVEAVEQHTEEFMCVFLPVLVRVEGNVIGTRGRKRYWYAWKETLLVRVLVRLVGLCM